MVDVEVDGGSDDEAALAAASAAATSQARLSWDDVSLSAARALRTELVERSPLVVALNIFRLVAGEAPELLVQHRAEGE